MDDTTTVRMVMFVATLPLFLLWIWSLVKSARNGQYGWFAACLLTSFLGSAAYLLFGPRGERQKSWLPRG